MKLTDKVQFAFRDLMHRKFRTFLTITAISVGAILLVFMMGIGDGVMDQAKKMVQAFGETNEISISPIDYKKSEEAMNKATANMGEVSSSDACLRSVDDTSVEQTEEEIKEDDFRKNITEEELNKIKNVEGVDTVTAYINAKVSYVKLEDKDYERKVVQVMGYNLSYKQDYGDKLIAGKNIENEDDIVIGENYLKLFGIDNAEDLLNKKITLKAEYPEMNGVKVKEPIEVTGTIVGVLQKKNYGNYIVTSDKNINPVAGYYTNSTDYIKDKGYDYASAFSKEGLKASTVANTIQNETGFSTSSFEAIEKILGVISKVVKGFLSIGGIIVLVVAALGLVNTMTMTLQEKRKMIGVMRSVGASRSNIRVVFIFQSMLLGIGGAVLGAVISVGGISIINEFVIKSSGFVIGIKSGNILATLIVTLVISVIAGLIPSGRAAKLNVVEAVAEE